MHCRPTILPFSSSLHQKPNSRFKEFQTRTCSVFQKLENLVTKFTRFIQYEVMLLHLIRPPEMQNVNVLTMFPYKNIAEVK